MNFYCSFTHNSKQVKTAAPKSDLNGLHFISKTRVTVQSNLQPSPARMQLREEESSNLVLKYSREWRTNIRPRPVPKDGMKRENIELLHYSKMFKCLYTKLLFYSYIVIMFLYSFLFVSATITSLQRTTNTISQQQLMLAPPPPARLQPPWKTNCSVKCDTLSMFRITQKTSYIQTKSILHVNILYILCFMISQVNAWCVYTSMCIYIN